jgi:hypothetical protein
MTLEQRLALVRREIEPEDVSTYVDTEPERAADDLVIEDVGTVAARVDATETPGYLARPVWPADAYGVGAAEDKAGKTWLILDLSVSVASGGAWLGTYDVETPGPVLVFLGEGSERKAIGRIRAVCAHQKVKLEDLPIRVCHRAPHLTSEHHLEQIHAELDRCPPRLIVVDPLYLAAKGANSASLYEMATVLEPIQHAAQSVGAALVVVHHWNQTGTGTGRQRMSGAGPAEWGRVLVSVAVTNRRTEDSATVVDLSLEFIGDEIPDTTLTIRRRVWADDPDDLASPMHYELDPVAPARAEAEEWDGPTECMAAVKQFLADHPDEEFSKNAMGQRLRAVGLRYRNDTIADSLEHLAADGAISVRIGARQARLFGHRGGDDDALDL